MGAALSPGVLSLNIFLLPLQMGHCLLMPVVRNSHRKGEGQEVPLSPTASTAPSNPETVAVSTFEPSHVKQVAHFNLPCLVSSASWHLIDGYSVFKCFYGL